MQQLTIQFTLNGEPVRVTVTPNTLLLNLLREQLELTGTKYVCGNGECGACTVHLDGKPVLSCLILAATVDGHAVTTIEGLVDREGHLDPVQVAYLEKGAYQCGYCTPGSIMTSKALLNENPTPSEEEIREYLRGNLCRCTGYTSIVRAVQHAAVHPTRDGNEQSE